MSIPTKITSELQALQSQVAAAAPLNKAPYPTIRAMQLNAGNLLEDIQTELTQVSTLDTWTAPPDPASMVAGFNIVVTSSNDQNNLSVMRGTVGRAAANLDRLA